MDNNTEFELDQYTNTSSSHVIGISDFFTKLAIVARIILPEGSRT